MTSTPTSTSAVATSDPYEDICEFCLNKQSYCTPPRQNNICFFKQQARCENCNVEHPGKCAPLCGSCRFPEHKGACDESKSLARCAICTKRHRTSDCWMVKPITANPKKLPGWRGQLWKHGQARRINELKSGSMRIVGVVSTGSLWHDRTKVVAVKVQRVETGSGFKGPIKMVSMHPDSIQAAKWHNAAVQAHRSHLAAVAAAKVKAEDDASRKKLAEVLEAAKKIPAIFSSIDQISDGLARIDATISRVNSDSDVIASGISTILEQLRKINDQQLYAK